MDLDKSAPAEGKPSPEDLRGRPVVDVQQTGYLSRHKHMMDYPAYHAAGYPLASAAIESTNKRLVSRRCKQGGMI